VKTVLNIIDLFYLKNFDIDNFNLLR